MSAVSKEVHSLGHVISQRDVENEVRSLQGFAGYYRRFVKGDSKIALPLQTSRMVNYTGGRRRSKKVSQKGTG